MAYAGGWKKLEPMWDWVIRARRVSNLLPVLESVLAGFHLPSKNDALNRIENILKPT
jgi:hypothetical protein